MASVLFGLTSMLLLGLPLCCLCDEILHVCVRYMVCQQEAGIEKSMACIQHVSKEDVSFLLKNLQDYYPDLKSVDEGFKVVCELPDEEQEAVVMHYYDERAKTDVTVGSNLENQKMMVEARECLSMMIDECRTKIEMGLLEV